MLGEVRPFHAAVRLTGNVDLPPLQSKGLGKVLLEAHELLGNAILVVDGLIALGEADVDRLLEPDNVGQEMEAKGVALGLFHTFAPGDRAILLEKVEQRGEPRLPQFVSISSRNRLEFLLTVDVELCQAG